MFERHIFLSISHVYYLMTDTSMMEFLCEMKTDLLDNINKTRTEVKSEVALLSARMDASESSQAAVEPHDHPSVLTTP